VCFRKHFAVEATENAMSEGTPRKRDFDELERRRIKAARLLKEGLSQAEVARRLDVSRESVRRWSNRLAIHGSDKGLKKAGSAGRKSVLTADQLNTLKSILRSGSAKAGYDPPDSWTLKRIAEVIERTFGVRYHVRHVSWVIRKKLGWALDRSVANPKKRSTQLGSQSKKSGGAARKRRVRKRTG
jgi:transposase